MVAMSSTISGIERAWRDRERIVTRMGGDRWRASFAAANRAVRQRRIAHDLILQTLHPIESMTRNRFTKVVGPSVPIARFWAMIAQPYQLYVERNDRAKNMARFYSLSIDANLFGELSVTRRWGRIGAKGQMMIHHFEREQDAVALFLNIIRQKRARGYRTRSAASGESATCAFRSAITE
jgi:predicted DNA-binding WGR domain protein